jgi:hypothetical protein
MMTKCRLMAEFKTGQVPTKDMSAKDRFTLLQGSVDIIRLTQAVVNYKSIEQWSWYFKGWVQWHAIAIVVAELGHNKNQQFVNDAWTVLDPVLGDWDKVYEAKRDEPAWSHVNTLITRAQEMRQQMQWQDQHYDAQQTVSNFSALNFGAAPTSVFSSPWQATWNAEKAACSNMCGFPVGQSNGHDMDNQLNGLSTQTPMASDTPYASGCAPSVPYQDWDFNYMPAWDGWENIDFSAFQGVFGDTAWDFSSPSTDFNFAT